MARDYAYYVDPKEEERQRLIEQELAYGPPAPDLPNLGQMSKGQISAADIEAAQAAAMRPTPVTDTQFAEEEETDQDLAEGLDAMQAEPDGDWAEYTPEQMQRALAYKKAQGQPVAPLPQQSLIEAEFAPQPGPLEAVAPGVLRQDMPLSPDEQARFKHGLPKTLGNTVDDNPFGELEELLPPAAPPPAPVDKTAASVSAEQKGVPAAPPPIGVRTDARIAKMDEETPARARDYGNQAERMTAPAEYQKGERTDLLGFDDEEGFSREKLIKRVQELYGQESAPESRWEDEFLRERGSTRMTDDQIRRRGAVIGFLGGAFEGDSSSGSRWADQQHSANRSFEEGRARARDRDQSNRRISRGMAEAIAATGQISPEAAVQLRMNDPLVKNFGQYASAGGRAEGQGIGLSKTKLGIMGGRVSGDLADERTREVAKLNAGAQIDAAAARGQAQQPQTPEQLRALGASWMASGLRPLGAKLTPEEAAAVLAGDRSKLTPEQAAKADTLTPNIEAGLADHRTRASVTADNLRAGVNAGQKTENYVAQFQAAAKADLKYAQKYQSEWVGAREILKNALGGWRKMSDAGKKAFSQWAKVQKADSIFDLSNLGDQWNKAFELTPEDQVHGSRVLAAINDYVKSNSGSAVTGSEWDRVAARTGLASGTWAPFNNPAVVEQYLMDSAKAMNQNRADYERIMGGWK